jgi:uncharacterized protein
LKTKLQQLFALQHIDSHLDELEELKGDLPAEVRALEAELAEQKGALAALEQEMRRAFADRDQADNDILSLREKLEKFKSQQNLVRTNREYDALAKEEDTARELIDKRSKDMELSEGKATLARSDMEGFKTKIGALEGQLAERREALAEISKTTEEEELMLKDKRARIVSRIAKNDLISYERIRKAKKGKAVVQVSRGACGGCYGKVPPQRLLELRQNERLYTCEHCGRILVSDEVASDATKLV